MPKRAIFWLDRVLRGKQGIVAYSESELSLLRISMSRLDEARTLPDGSPVMAGSNIIDLHLWNERVGGLGLGLLWAVKVRRGMEHSMILLAERLETDRALCSCAAIRARIAFVDSRSAPKFTRIARRFGLESEGGNQARMLGPGLLSLALTWATNPGSLKGKRFRPAQATLWIGVPAFRQRFCTTKEPPPFRAVEVAT
ncbi:MAG: hypothetical protein ACREFW_08310 [Rhizomicrobium sp.]